MSDDTPTQRFDTPASPANPPAGPPPEEKKKSRGLLIALIAVGALLLIALIVLVIVLVRGGAGQSASSVNPLTTSTASAAPTPTVTASATPSSAPSASSPPSAKATSGSGGGSAPTGGEFTVFNPTLTVSCSAGGPGFTPPPQPIKITWKAIRTQGVYFAFNNTDGASSGLTKLPASGSEADFDGEVDFPCSDPSRQATYNLTLVGDDGKHVMKTWTVKNVGEAP